MDPNSPSSSQIGTAHATAIDSKFAELRQLIDSTSTPGGFEQLSQVEVQYRKCLMENICEGVIFVDPNCQITSWNRGAETITGLTSATMLGTSFAPSLLGLRELDSQKLDDHECPVRESIKTGKQTMSEFRLVGRSGRESNVELKIVPVIHDRSCHGAVVLFRDLSANVDLQRQLNDLYNASVLDPLTHVANRAEFEKNLRLYAQTHKESASQCCIIICDIDYFKQVNDTYGHHIGDQALVAFAQMLKKFVRAGDLVARYGGEEFVILCANCDLQSAVERAEQIRQSLNKTPQQMLNGKTISASFGVAELGDDEDITEFFVRADKALYSAKKRGRNRVEQDGELVENVPSVGTGNEQSVTTGIKWRKLSKGALFSQEYRTKNPASLMDNKLQVFIVEYKPQIRSCEPGYYNLVVLGRDPKRPNRKTHFHVFVEITEAKSAEDETTETYVRITIMPPKPRVFRKVHEDLHEHIVADLRHFLLINDESAVLKLNLAAESSGRDE